jgi:O-glycosyl hydrolase
MTQTVHGIGGWLAIAIAGMVSAIGSSAEAQETPRAEPARVSIDVREQHQVIDGFGASGAWWHHWVGDYPADKRDHLLDLLFSDRGIALSIFRYNLPVGGGSEIHHPERATAKVEVSPGVFDLSADRKALEILRGVRERGVERFVLFANSPPGRLTRNGLTSGGEKGGSNLRPGEERAFGEYLVTLGTLIRDTYRLPHVTLSPINEPQWTWGKDWRGQEGCHYTPEEVARTLRAVIEVSLERQSGFRIEAPESGEWKSMMQYADAMFADPLIAEHVEDFAVHSYWTGRGTKERVAPEFFAKYPTKRLAMTEYCEMKHGHDVGIESGVRVAEVVHDDLTIGNVVTWQWWLGVAGGGYGDGLIYAHPKTQVIEPTKKLWTLGQYSRFVRPGFVRVAATSPDERVRASAFLSGSGERLVCVMINPSKEAIEAIVTPDRWEARNTRVYFTDATHDLAERTPAAATIPLPPLSVTTVVMDR